MEDNTKSDVWEWCRKRGMEVEESAEEVTASEPGLTIYWNENGFQIEQRNPEVGVLMYINTKESSVSVIGSQLVVDEGGSERVFIGLRPDGFGIVSSLPRPQSTVHTGLSHHHSASQKP